MDFVPYRLLRNEPGKLRERLTQQGQLVLTSEGQPIALMVSVEPGRLEETLRLVAQLRAQMAVTSMREEARRRGLERMTSRQVADEIRRSRRSRRR